MRTVLLSCCLSLFAPLSAQTVGDSSHLMDVVALRDGTSLTGTLLEYRYGRRVVLVTESGATRTLPWEAVKRVNFRETGSRETTAPETGFYLLAAPPRERPRRPYLHQVSAALGVGTTQGNFGSFGTIFGGGFSYHLVRPLGRFVTGAGLGVNLMSHRRSETVATLTGLVDYPLGRPGRKVRPFLRLEGGPSLPVGTPNDRQEITKRELTFLVHPAIGLAFPAPEGQWGTLLIDVGYRFLDSRFEVTTESLDVIERVVQYRRLVFRGSLRF